MSVDWQWSHELWIHFVTRCLPHPLPLIRTFARMILLPTVDGYNYWIGWGLLTKRPVGVTWNGIGCWNNVSWFPLHLVFSSCKLKAQQAVCMCCMQSVQSVESCPTPRVFMDVNATFSGVGLMLSTFSLGLSSVNTGHLTKGPRPAWPVKAHKNEGLEALRITLDSILKSPPPWGPD